MFLPCFTPLFWYSDHRLAAFDYQVIWPGDHGGEMMKTVVFKMQTTCQTVAWEYDRLVPAACGTIARYLLRMRAANFVAFFCPSWTLSTLEPSTPPGSVPRLEQKSYWKPRSLLGC